MENNMVIELNRDDLDPGKVPADDKMHIIMFYGSTCGPCKFTMPFYEETATYFTERTDKIKFYKLHAWETDEVKQYLSDTFDVTGVPKFISFLHGVHIHTKLGGGKREDMMKYVQDSIDNAFKNLGVRI